MMHLANNQGGMNLLNAQIKQTKEWMSERANERANQPTNEQIHQKYDTSTSTYNNIDELRKIMLWKPACVDTVNRWRLLYHRRIINTGEKRKINEVHFFVGVDNTAPWSRCRSFLSSLRRRRRRFINSFCLRRFFFMSFIFHSLSLTNIFLFFLYSLVVFFPIHGSCLKFLPKNVCHEEDNNTNKRQRLRNDDNSDELSGALVWF